MSYKVKEIIYEDEDIRAFLKKGSSNFLLITFSDLTGVGKDVFFAEKPVFKNNISCIGVIAKKTNWYPSKNMIKLKKNVAPLTSAYRNIVLYGGSMGGYAAVKYSRLFCATHVIALCPQWSINPTECDGLQGRLARFYNDSMGNMGITKSDVSGSVYLFSDPHDVVDDFHRKMIQKNCDSEFIKFYSAGHTVTTIVAGSNNLSLLIESCINGQLSKLKKFVGRVKKNHPMRFQVIIERASIKHPVMISKVLINDLNQGRKFTENALASFPVIVENLFLSGASIFDFYRAFLGEVQPFHKKYMYMSILSNLPDRLCGVTTYHGTLLAFDFLDGSCKAVSFSSFIENKFKYSILKVKIKCGSLSFYVDSGLGVLHLGIEINNRKISALYSSGFEESWFNIEESTDGGFYLSNCGVYLSATKSGRLVCDREKASHFERFNIGVIQ